jgi:hypothetical protein
MKPSRAALAAVVLGSSLACLGGIEPGGLGDPATHPAASDAGASAPTSPAACGSGQRWTGGDKGSDRMYPGRACAQCHLAMREGPRLGVAGTVFATLREVDDCNGVDGRSGLKVIIQDAAGVTLELAVNAAGNFFAKEQPLTPPLSAKVSRDGRELAMKVPVPTGDCNTCHTQSGAAGAPGRIVPPQ